ncbi:hypothetical protein AWB81_07393 [Caballeronia arationis]|uniref:hypothetical protein n=1 Tax=Caballeronia arationis TaxID=1777142 RepID=UPI00074BE488|nr:hypothetical protein [Caballeronia arationis]SAL05981.1 hypothetical protein AWB81_07393 [Caballeronia arationis]
MTVLKWTGVIYLILSAVSLLGTFFVLLYEDYKLYRDPLRRATSKIGYNLKWNGIGWMLLLGCLPILNLIVLFFFSLPIWVDALTEWFHNRCASQSASNK